MEEYIKVDVAKYVKEEIESGNMVPRKCEKIARIIARQGKIGEIITSWSVDNLGNEIEERVAQINTDEETKEPSWIATKVDEEGRPIIDINGNPNQWIIDDSIFKKKYEIDKNNPNLYKPKGEPQLFVQINDNIILNQSGEEFQIAKGGYINITNADDMYGISQKDFEDSYKFID